MVAWWFGYSWHGCCWRLWWSGGLDHQLQPPVWPASLRHEDQAGGVSCPRLVDQHRPGSLAFVVPSQRFEVAAVAVSDWS